MSRDPASEVEPPPTQSSLEARRDRLSRRTQRRALTERRAEITGIFTRLGFADLAARFEGLPAAMCVSRIGDGTIRVMNDECVQLFGYSSADHVGKTTTDLSIWADSVDRERFVASLREHGEVTGMETRLRRADGVTIPVLLSGRPFEDLRGEQSILSVVHDVTERKRAEEALRQSEEHYRSIVTTMDEGAILVDRSGRIASLNPASERILGVRAEDLVGQSLEERVLTAAHTRADGSPLPVEMHPAYLALRTGTPQSCHVMGVRRPDGSIVWISVNALALLSEGESDPHGALSTFRDVTEQRVAETALRHREADLERLLAERESNLALVERSLASAVRVACEVVETRDPYTGGHQRRVSELATRIAQDMELPAAQVEEIRVAALIHDVGTMAVPIEILSKPGALSALEFSLVRGHAEAGHQIVSSAGMAGDTAEIVYQHHERCDGSGYPRGLSSDALLLGAKVLMVADVVEAMASHRPYRAALGLAAALGEIHSGAGGRYDAEVCRACVGVFRDPDFAFSEQ